MFDIAFPVGFQIALIIAVAGMIGFWIGQTSTKYPSPEEMLARLIKRRADELKREHDAATIKSNIEIAATAEATSLRSPDTTPQSNGR